MKRLMILLLAGLTAPSFCMDKNKSFHAVSLTPEKKIVRHSAVSFDELCLRTLSDAGQDGYPKTSLWIIRGQLWKVIAYQTCLGDHTLSVFPGCMLDVLAARSHANRKPYVYPVTQKTARGSVVSLIENKQAVGEYQDMLIALCNGAKKAGIKIISFGLGAPLTQLKSLDFKKYPALFELYKKKLANQWYQNRLSEIGFHSISSEYNVPLQSVVMIKPLL